MTEPSYGDWSRTELITKVKQQEKELREYIQAEQVMIAAGLVSEAKVKQAHEIVQSFS